jgi:hypothetical protein
MKIKDKIQGLVDRFVKDKELTEAEQLTRPDGRTIDMAAIRLTNLRTDLYVIQEAVRIIEERFPEYRLGNDE